MGNYSPTITSFGLDNNSETVLKVRWSDATSNPSQWKIQYFYKTGYKESDVWIPDSSSTVDYGNTKVHTYSGYPDNAVKVAVKVGGVYSDGKKTDWSSNMLEWTKWSKKTVEYKTKSVSAPTGVTIKPAAGNNTVRADWKWSQKNTDYYIVFWKYLSSAGNWFTSTMEWFNGNGADGETTVLKYSTYTYPEDAIKLRFTVRPVSKYWTIGSKDYYYWKAKTSTAVTYTIKSASLPEVPSAPEVALNDLELTAEVLTDDPVTNSVQFLLGKYGSNKTIETITAVVKSGHAAVKFKCTANVTYHVKCRGVSGKKTKIVKGAKSFYAYSDWSAWSSALTTRPKTPSGFTKHETLTEQNVDLYWDTVSGATGYDIEYSIDKRYLGNESDSTQTISIDSNTNHHIIEGLDTGQRWYFRIRAKNGTGVSGWSKVYSIILGTIPDAPTTWAEASTVLATENIKIFWIHNSKDSSTQTRVAIDWALYGGSDSSIPVESNREVFTKDNVTDISSFHSWEFETSEHAIGDGAIFTYKVATRGIVSTTSPFSGEKIVNIYTQPSLEVLLSDIYSDPQTQSESVSEITTLPITVRATAYPSVQSVVGWDVSIIAQSSYNTTNFDGTTKQISAGETIYSEYIHGDGTNNLEKTFSAGDVALENNESYVLTVIAAMNSGFKADSDVEFVVSWDSETDVVPNAEISIDPNSLAAYIRPYCALGVSLFEELLDSSGYEILDSDEVSIDDTVLDDSEDDGGEMLLPNMTLAVYRISHDGTFVEIASGLENTRLITVVDPHPALNVARYRIVAISTETGSVSYYDMPGVEVGETGIVIQWDEDWTSFNMESQIENEQYGEAMTGSMLKLPYNVDIQDSYSPDVSFVEYIGRKNPVSYYGTQKGVTATWNADIARDDYEQIYAIRRLAAYSGNVYVREPSGSGYWANVKVSFSRKHLDNLIPVTLNITRVEGGI